MKIGNYTIRKATAEDTDDIIALLVNAANWIKTKGFDQWDYYLTDLEKNKQEIVDSIEHQASYVLKDRMLTIATVTLEGRANEWDDEIWGEEAKQPNVIYLHRLVVHREYAGQNLGSKIINWSKKYVKNKGYSCIRFDCIGSNEKLNEYYKQHCPLKERIEIYGGHSKYEIPL
ncbi:GNAT family N-acetyltransferase [Evansella halocellulosilytica]|uniref:GNAT family N-acetyltransferase n=1 Tax=Evansella halocellulosilytica TaxID=2011013 RepID=UPI000BB87994|nr:GNAT family N-acetyltransferase [Evansella halocellulosilytica]